MDPKNSILEEQKQFGDKPERRDATTSDFRFMEERVVECKTRNENSELQGIPEYEI